MSNELEWLVFIETGERPIQLLITAAEKKAYSAANFYKCNHEKTEFRIRSIMGGSRQRTRQCLICGKAVGNAAKMEGGGNVPDWDNLLAENAGAKLAEKRKRIYEIALRRTVRLETQGYSDYEEYLASDEWAKKRRAVFQRDAALCQACLSREATEVHHLTYDRIYREPMFDLVAICRACHETLHRKKIAAIAAAKAKSSDIPDFLV